MRPPTTVVVAIVLLVATAVLGPVELATQPALLSNAAGPAIFDAVPGLYRVVAALVFYAVPFAVTLVLALYLWRGRDWARMVVLFSNAIPGAQAVVLSGFLTGLVTTAPNDATSVVRLLAIVLALAAVILLFVPASRAWFKGAALRQE